MEQPNTRNAPTDSDDGNNVSYQPGVPENIDQIFDTSTFIDNSKGLSQETYTTDNHGDDIVPVPSESEVMAATLPGGDEGSDIGNEETEYHWLDDYGGNTGSKQNQDLSVEAAFQVTQEEDITTNEFESNIKDTYPPTSPDSGTIPITDGGSMSQDERSSPHIYNPNIDAGQQMTSTEPSWRSDAMPEESTGEGFITDQASTNPDIVASFSNDPELSQNADREKIATAFGINNDMNLRNESLLDNKERSLSQSNLGRLSASAFEADQPITHIRQNKSSDNLAHLSTFQTKVMNTGSEPSLAAAVRTAKLESNSFASTHQGATDSVNFDRKDVETDNTVYGRRTDSFIHAVSSKVGDTMNNPGSTSSISQEESKVRSVPVVSDRLSNPTANTSSAYQNMPQQMLSNNPAANYNSMQYSQQQLPAVGHHPARELSFTEPNQQNQGIDSLRQPYHDRNQMAGNELNSDYASQYQHQAMRPNNQGGSEVGQYYNYHQHYPYASYPYQQYYYYPNPWDPYGYQYQQYQDWYYSTYYQNSGYYGQNPSDNQQQAGIAEHQYQEAQYYENYLSPDTQQPPLDTDKQLAYNNAQGGTFNEVTTYDNDKSYMTDAIATPTRQTYDANLTTDNNVANVDAHVDDFPQRNDEATLGDFSEIDAAYPTRPDEDLNIQEDEEDQKPPLLHVAPHVRCSFSFGGKMVMTSVGDASNIVTFSEIQDSVSERKLKREVKNFPGPLMCDDTHKRDIIDYIETRIADPTDRTETPSSRLLWRYLLMGIRQNGTIVNTDISELLLNDEQSLGRDYDKAEDNISESECIDTEELQEPSYSPFKIRTIEQEYRQLLLQGKKREALEIAVNNGLWGHAMILSSRLDSRIHKMVIGKFFQSMKEGDALLTLYQVFDGQQPNIINKRTMDTNWRSHLAMLLSNTTSNSKFDKDNVISLGDQLVQSGDIFCGHLCYLAAGLLPGHTSFEKENFTLIGQNSVTTSLKCLDVVDIHRTEICEYIHTLQKPGDAFPKFQPYKFMYVTLLSELGGINEALQYLESMAFAIYSNPKNYSKSFIKTFVNFSARATYFNLDDSYEDEIEPEWLSNLRSLLGTSRDLNDNYRNYSSDYNNFQQFNNSGSTDDTAQNMQDNYRYQKTASPSYVGGGGNLSLVHTPAESNKSAQQFTFDNTEINKQQENKPALYSPKISTNYQSQESPKLFYNPVSTSQSYNPVSTSQSYNPVSTSQSYNPVSTSQSYNPVSTSQGYNPINTSQSYNPVSVSQSQSTGGIGSLNPIYQPPGNESTVPPSNAYIPETESNQQISSSASTFQPNKDTIKPSDQTDAAEKTPAKTPGRKVKSKGWLSTVSSMIFKGKNEMHLPDDRKPSIYYDEDRKKWVDSDNPEEATKAAAPPPSDTQLTKPALPSIPIYQQPTSNATNDSKPQQQEQPQESATATPANNSYSIFKGRGGKMGGRSQYVDVFGGNKSETTTTQNNTLPPNFLNPVQRSTVAAKPTANFFVPSASHDDVSDPFADSVSNVNSTESLPEEAANAPGKYQQVTKQPSNREFDQQSRNRQGSNESYSQGMQSRYMSQNDSHQGGYAAHPAGTAPTHAHDAYSQSSHGAYPVTNVPTSQAYGSDFQGMENRYSHDLASSYGTESNISDVGHSISDATGVSDSVQSTPRQPDYQNEANKPQDIYQQTFPIQGSGHVRTSSFNRQKRPPLSLGGAYY